jgi:hypothetical protein
MLLIGKFPYVARDEGRLPYRDSSNAAQMAKELLWEKDTDLALSDFVDVSQT